MPTNLETAVETYVRARILSRGTQDEYFSTLRKWKRWGGSVPIEELTRKDIREFLDWVHERAILQEGTNPGRTANKARENLRALMSWAWEQDLIESLPRFPKPRPQRGLTLSDKGRTQCPLLCDSQYETSARLESSFTRWTLLAMRPRRVLQLRRRHRDNLEICAVPRADPLAACIVGSAVTEWPSERKVALGMDLLSQGEGRQDLLPPDESRRSRTHQEHHARRSSPE